jgi:hypothetical protein
MNFPEPQESIMVNADDSQPLPGGNKFSKYPIISSLFRYFTWWLIFTGIYASSSVCPFCGRAGCPVGGVSAGLVGGLFALILAKGKLFLHLIAEKFLLLWAKLSSKFNQ